MPKVFVHTVHTRFSSAPTEKRHELLRRFQKLGEECGGASAGILFWKVSENLQAGPRRKVDMVQFAVFENEAAFETFRAHPNHQALKLELREHADWTGADIEFSSREGEKLARVLED